MYANITLHSTFRLFFSYRNQAPLHGKDFRHLSLQSHADFEGEQDRRIRRPPFDGHYRLPADADSQSQLFLRHPALETQAADIVVQCGWHRKCGTVGNIKTL